MVLVAVGCGSGSSKKDKSKKSADVPHPEDNRVVNTKSGNAVGYSVEGERMPLWKVGWQEAKIILLEGGNTVTQMKGASGTFLKDGKDASNFQSATGTADKGKGDIDVDGQVVVVSLTDKATLRCDHIHYASKGQQIVQATGNVRVDGEWGTVSGLQEVWATPDLKVFGTPDLFQKR